MHAINLLGTKENEASLSVAYAQHIEATQKFLGESIGLSHFDFHNAVRIGGHESISYEFMYVNKPFKKVIYWSASIRRLEHIQDNIDKFGLTIYDTAFEDILSEQTGVFRVNCLDWWACAFSCMVL